MEKPPDKKLPREWKHTPNGITIIVTILVFFGVFLPFAIEGSEPGFVWGVAIFLVVLNVINLARITRARRKG